VSDQLIYRKPDLPRVTGLSSRTVERMEAEGRFPARVKISTRLVGWRASEVQSWLRDRCNEAP